MKLVVAGSRSFNNFPLLEREIKVILRYNVIELIISGGAAGADTLAIWFAKCYKLECQVMRADWKLHGKAAGHIRNKAMAKEGDALIAFWDGFSKGTANMIEEMKTLGKPTTVILF